MQSIRSKLIAFAILATLVPSVALGVLSFWRYQSVVSDHVNHELRALAGDASAELTLWYRERVGELRTLSTAYTLSDGLSQGAERAPIAVPVGARELAQYLRSVRGRLGSIVELTLSDNDGQVVASSAPTPSPMTLPDNWPGTAHTEGVVLSPPRRDAARGTATLTVVVPVLSLRNEVLGSLAAVLDLATVGPRLQDLARSSPAELLLLGADGSPLLATGSDPAALTPLASATVDRLRAQPGEALTFDGHHAREVIGAADVSRVLPVMVVAERDRAEVFAAWLALLEFFLLLVAGLTLLVGAVAFAMGRSIVLPLNRLITAADGIARGEFDIRVPGEPAGEIGRLTRVFNAMADRLRGSRAEVEAASRALREKNRQLEVLAVTDGLTGLYNRKKLDDILVDQFARFRRSGRPFALLMLDLDNFKAINDSYGHVTGDEVLTTLAALLKQSVRAVDYVARYGGEEFVVVLVETPLGAALEVAERVRAGVQAPRFSAGSGTFSISVSLGVTHSRQDDDDPEKMLFRADHALYQAKRAGRNQVQFAS